MKRVLVFSVLALMTVGALGFHGKKMEGVGTITSANGEVFLVDESLLEEAVKTRNSNVVMPIAGSEPSGGLRTHTTVCPGSGADCYVTIIKRGISQRHNAGMTPGGEHVEIVQINEEGPDTVSIHWS